MSGNWQSKILEQDAETRIEARLAQFEERTHAELVIAIHGSSGPYPAATYRFALLFVCIATFAASLAFGAGSPGWLAAVPWIALLCGLKLGAIHPFNEMSRTPAELERNSRLRANECFSSYRIDETTHRSGVFFFVSLSERKFHLKLDREIAKRVPEEKLRHFSQRVSAHFRQGSMESGLIEAIDWTEARILEAFPGGLPAPGTGDRLKNSIRWRWN